MSSRNAELALLAVLLTIVALFYWVVVPAGVVDPEGFGLDQGLPPSFSPRLVAILAAVLMVLRGLRLLLTPASSELAQDEALADGDVASEERSPIAWRTVGGIAAALVFAFVLASTLGFVLGGLVLLPVLLVIMGERRPLALLVQPVVVTALIWLLFEQLLSIRLPPGMVFLDG